MHRAVANAPGVTASVGLETMTVDLISTLAAKMAWSAVIVIGLSLIAERVSTSVAGILAGAPLGTFFVFLFVGLEHGPGHVVESVPHSIAAFSATCAFVLTYCVASKHIRRWQLMLSTVSSVTVFVLVCLLLVRVDFDIPVSIALTVTACFVSYRLMAGIAPLQISKPVRFTLRVVLLRAALASLFVALAVAVALALGTRWTGLMTGFPMTMLPTLMIVHANYGAEATHSMLRNCPLGMGSIVIYILVVHQVFPHWGVISGTALAMSASFIYLGIVVYWQRSRRELVSAKELT